MEIQVLGAAAGGGFPQWNCNCENCRAFWSGDPELQAQTQSSIAVSADGARFALFNASPDLRQQIERNPALHPKTGLRDSPIRAAVLTNGDVDHVAGLLNLRESQPFGLYATSRIHEVLAANTVFNVLNPDFVDRRTFRLNEAVELKEGDGTPLGLTVTVFPVPGKVALWLEDKNAEGGNFGTVDEDTVGLEIADNAGRRVYYIPGCARMTEDLAARLDGADVVFFDGTLWTDDEMIRQQVGIKTGQRMGHISMSGDDGSIAAFRDLKVGRKIFIHINNTNPVLRRSSPERAETEAAGWTIAEDGMTVRA
ncbi:MAG: pyrroloquinoline quinone biosynthesis protein PqqB [Minwuia sp.]|uniref:pyrroloquinoline quinone biosynthesis protein PqqB n=1 Tax=Minwuia sp. TaxID=2493630 RepID=UPI003A86837E